MGCCCPKEKSNQDNDDVVDERSRLLSSSDQKSRFVDPVLGASQLNQNTSMGTGPGSLHPSSINEAATESQYLINQQNENAYGNQQQQQNLLSESNQMFEKILSEVIHVSSAFDQRATGMGGAGGYQSNDLMQFSSVGLNLNMNPVQDMPFKIKGLLEPQTLNKQQQLTLPEGVPAPFSVLAAQPPFSNDIRLINNVAYEAYSCINNFSLNVPDNVAFDFKPVVL